MGPPAGEPGPLMHTQGQAEDSCQVGILFLSGIAVIFSIFHIRTLLHIWVC